MGRLLLFFTNLIFPFAAIGVFFSFLFSARRGLLKHLKQELKERFGLEDEAEIPQNAIWLHCASVGEVLSMREVINQLSKIYKNPIIVTTSTQAGKETAQKNPQITKAFLAPLDFYPSCKRFIKLAKPFRLFVVEREIWPNMLWAAHTLNVPSFLLNGRISEKSTKAYKLVAPLFRTVLAPLEFATLHTQEDAGRYASLGINENKLHVCGNVKYDTLSDQPKKLTEVDSLIKSLGWKGEKIFVLGSTHPLEEEILFKAFPAIHRAGVKVIFAPRHLERSQEIKENLGKTDYNFAFLSDGVPTQKVDLLCADVMGLLQSLYARATFAFVGGSIAPRGAHNLLEPAILTKVVLFGKHFYNTPLTAHALLEKGGGLLVDANNFEQVVLQLVSDMDLTQNMSEQARLVALSFKGATEKITTLIKEYEKRHTA